MSAPQNLSPHPSEAPPLLHSSFYRFVPLADPQAAAQALRRLAETRGLAGSVVVAREGVSGAIAGPQPALLAFELALNDALGGALSGIRFKHSACSSLPFGRLKVSVKPEIVALDLPAAATGGSLPAPDGADDSHLSPQAWRELLASGNAVLLDNRSHFEFRLGHFRGATDPQVHDFRDFVAYVEQHAAEWRAAQRPVAMYCTGGIRCDKTAPWMRSLGLQVLQLDGGILNYFQQVPDAQREWAGECFVFDRRIAIDTQLQETPTRAEDVFDPQIPDEAWRLRRARELDGGAS